MVYCRANEQLFADIRPYVPTEGRIERESAVIVLARGDISGITLDLGASAI